MKKRKNPSEKKVFIIIDKNGRKSRETAYTENQAFFFHHHKYLLKKEELESPQTKCAKCGYEDDSDGATKCPNCDELYKE